MDQSRAFEIANQYISFLVEDKKLEIDEVFIFGSYSKNQQHEDSDIDLALGFHSLEDRFGMQLQLMKWRRDFDLSIEPHPFDRLQFNKNNPFAYEILTTGQRMYGSPV